MEEGISVNIWLAKAHLNELAISSQALKKLHFALQTHALIPFLTTATQRILGDMKCYSGGRIWLYRSYSKFKIFFIYRRGKTRLNTPEDRNSLQSIHELRQGSLCL
jgi:hypothetical protein